MKARRSFLAGIAAALAFVGPGRAAPEDEAIVRRVADAILRQTTRRLVDTASGAPIADSSGLAPRREIRIESKFNAWFYQTALLADGMRRCAEALDEPAYRGYGEANLGFIARHLPFFERQHGAGMKMPPIGDGNLSPIAFHFELGALWHSGLAPLVLERRAATGDTAFDPYLRRLDAFLEKSPRFEDGTFHRPGKGLMSDDAYMTVPYLLRKSRLAGDPAALDLAVAQVLGTHRRLHDPRAGLLRHLWDLRSGRPAGVFWGRGNGWVVLAHVELLAALPADHPARPEVLAAFRRHMEGLRRCQHPEGGWHQVLDHPESWIETSATGMITYGMARGAREGWLDPGFARDARAGWRRLRQKVTADGDLTDVCASTDVGDLAYYLGRPRLRGDLHGYGSFLLAGSEILRAGD